MNGVTPFILVHNHRSGEPDPSQNDICTTERIVPACNPVGIIKVLDYIIIGKNVNGFVSLSQKGLIR